MASRSDQLRRRVLALVALAVLLAFTWWAWSVIHGAVSADSRGAEVVDLEIDSRAVGGTEPVSVVVPAEHAAHPPLLVFLHGRGGDEESSLGDAMYDGLAALGRRAPVVAFPDGGDSSYWHDRSSGRWAGTSSTR